jgi:hypothetical protein
MTRHRDIAASPVRTAFQTWETIANLIVSTLERSPDLDTADIRHTLNLLAPVGLALVAAGHLDRQPLTLTAAPLHLTINTRSGEEALRALEEENLNPVPGAATATSWMLYLPRPDGITALIDDITSDLTNVSTDPAPVSSEPESKASTAVDIDLGRLKLGS